MAEKFTVILEGLIAILWRLFLVMWRNEVWKNSADVSENPASFLVISFTMIMAVAGPSETLVVTYWQRNSENTKI